MVGGVRSVARSDRLGTIVLMACGCKGQTTQAAKAAQAAREKAHQEAAAKKIAIRQAQAEGRRVSVERIAR